MPAEEIPFDPTVAVAEDDVVEEDVDTGDLETTVPPPFSLRAMMKTFMTTQEADDSGGHYLTTWIQGEEFQIIKQRVSKALHVHLVCRPTYPYTETSPIDDVMTLLCGRTVT